VDRMPLQKRVSTVFWGTKVSHEPLTCLVLWCFLAGMKFIADLHVHSHYSRATSESLDPEHLDLWAQKKGISVIGTGDFTHPAWVSELREKLCEAEDGLYRLRPDLQRTVNSRQISPSPGPSRFLLSGEISCIYKKNGKTRKVHHLILLPDFQSVDRFNDRLARIGNLASDGRPIVGIDSKDLLEMALQTSDKAFFIPAHIWTPWFSVFGSKSGFDTLDECFEDLTEHIHALETGLSSDPPMNRLLSSLDRYLLVSNSDAHSPAKLGREANLFSTELNYESLIHAMKSGEGFAGTIEFFPQEGKYHLDGHRKCRVRLHPAESKTCDGICPACGKPLTLGVLHRVVDLSDREKPKLSKDFYNLIPLAEILSELLGCGPGAKKVLSAYERLLSELGPELKILLDVPLSDVASVGGPLLAEAIGRMRLNQVVCEEGYDGEYGVIRLFQDTEMEALAGQMTLFQGQPEQDPKPSLKAPLKGETGKPRDPLDRRAAFPLDPILDPLNPEQKSAVLHQGKHLLVVAGPGTGKTMTLTHRIAHLIRDGLADPEQVLAITFTRKAAREMAQRVSRLLEGVRPCHVRVATFHAFCLELLRSEAPAIGLPPDFAVCSETDADNLSRQFLRECGESKGAVRKFLKALPHLRKASALEGFEDVTDHETLALFLKYRQTFRQLGMVGLDDLEVEALRLLNGQDCVPTAWSRKHPWIFVDEYQDTNALQAEILKILSRAGPVKICAIGDPDQAIYGFRGADVSCFHRFFEDFPGAREIVLTRNYRSSQTLLESAASVMKKPQPLQSERGDGKPLSVASCGTEAEEAEMIVEQIERLIGGTSYFSLDSGRVDSHEGDLSLGFADIAVLYRLNAQGEALEKALSRAGIPYARSGEAPLTGRYPVNLLWRFFQALHYPNQPYYERLYQAVLADSGIKIEEAQPAFDPDLPLSELIDRAVAYHAIDCSDKDVLEGLQRLKQLATGFENHREAFLDALSLERGIDHATLAGDRVALMSLHAAKGLEWPVVFITGCEDGLIPCSLFGPTDEDEERRLFYVGMTRARHGLILSHARRRSIHGRILSMARSPYLDAIPPQLCSPLERRGWKPKPKPHKQLSLFIGP